MCQALLLRHPAYHMQKGLHLIMQLLNSTWHSHQCMDLWYSHQCMDLWYSHQCMDLWYNHQYISPVHLTQCVPHLAMIHCRGWDTHYSKNPVSSFTLCFIAGNITTYKNKYPKQSQAPYDLCIKHQEWRQFRSPTTATPQSKFGNTYYHCQLKCVWMWHPNFIASGLQVSSEIIVLSSQASHFQCVWTKPIASYQECVV